MTLKRRHGHTETSVFVAFLGLPMYFEIITNHENQENVVKNYCTYYPTWHPAMSPIEAS